MADAASTLPLSAEQSFVTLRDDLIFTPLPDGRGSWMYQIEDLSRSKFFRIGLAEYTFISLLNGKTTLKRALELTRASKQASTLTEADALSICRWLIQTQLASMSRQGALDSQPQQKSENKVDPPRMWNPLFFRVPIASPDNFIRKMLGVMKWIHSPAAIFFWLLLLLFASYLVSCQWPRFSAAAVGILAPDNWIWLFANWVILKTLHEMSHAVVCRKYGGRVGMMGVMVVLFAPLAYVDVSSSWRFASRWQRIHVALAGIYMDLGIAAVAAILWSWTSSDLVGHRLYSIVLISGVSTLVFNANPLMKSDGYYVLTDIWGIPNLHKVASGEIIALIKRFLGEESFARSSFNTSTRIVLILFGLAVWTWRLFVYTCLVIGTATLFHGAGIVVAYFIGVSLALPVLLAVSKMLKVSAESPQVNPLRRGLLGFGILALLVLLGWGVSWKQHCTAPGIVRQAPYAIVRTRCAGFLTQVSVPEHGFVRKGQLLAVLTNDELAAEYNSLRVSVEETRLKCQLLLRQHEDAEHRIEQERLAGLEKQRQEKQIEFEGLQIYAPVDGQVANRALTTMIGTHYEAGSDLLMIGGEDAPELRISVAQQDVRGLSLLNGRELNVRIAGVGPLKGTLERIVPRGSDRLTQHELSASNGGPLPVTADTNAEHGQSAQDVRLLAPRFDAVIVLQTPVKLWSGQYGVASWSGERMPLIQRLIVRFQDWLRTRSSS